MTPVRSEVDLPQVFAPTLRRLREDAPALSLTPGAHVTPVSYQARLFSNVLRVGVSSADGSHVAYWFAKIQTPKAVPDGMARVRARVVHEFEITEKVERALSAQGNLEALHPVTCYPDLFAIVTQELQGVTLLRHLERRLYRFASAATRLEAERAAGLAGAWLRSFQTIDPSDELLDVDLRPYIDLRLQRLVSSGRSPIGALMRERILKHLQALAEATPMCERRSVIVHADLAPGNVMVTERGVAVLDFAMAARGAYLQDITRLALQIDMLRGKPQFGPDAVRRAVDALLRGFAPGLSARQPLFRLFTLRHRVNHLATLTLKRGEGAARLYNGRLRRMHERCIDTELATPVGEEAPSRLDAAPYR